VVRRYPYGDRVEGKFRASMGALLAGSSTVRQTPFHIDFSIRSETIPVVSYVDVLAATKPPWLACATSGS
jgi:hypothetical protein